MTKKQIQAQEDEYFWLQKQKENEKYQEFVKDYQKPKQANLDPIKNNKQYMLGTINDTITLSDQLIRYKQDFQNINNNKLKSLKKYEQKHMQDQEQAQNLIQIKKVFKNQRAFSPKNDKSVQDQTDKTSDEDILDQINLFKQKSGKKIQKVQNMCIVEKLALNFMHSLYKQDDRYIVDPLEDKRMKYINMDTKQYKNEILMRKKQQILCIRHGDIQFDEKQYKDQIFIQFKQFYEDLLEDKHSKVSKEKICKAFLDHVMDDRNYMFNRLKKQILNIENQDKNDSFKLFRDLNPQIFLKEEKKEQDIQSQLINSSIKQKIEIVIPIKNQVCNLIPNTKIFVNEQIFESLVKGMIDLEVQQKLDQIQKTQIKRFSKNDLIDLNIKARHLNEKQKQIDMAKKNNQDTNDQKTKILENFKKKLVENLRNTLQDILQKQQLNKTNIIKKQNMEDMLKKQKTISGEQKFNALKKRETQTILDVFENQIVQETNIKEDFDEQLPENAKELFKQEYQKRKFYALQKSFNKSPNSQMTNENKYFIELNKKFRLIVPHFIKIQNQILNIQNTFLNSDTISVLSEYIIGQTDLLQKKKILINKKIDIMVNEDYIDLRDLQQDNIIVKSLIVDDCQMKDQDFATLFYAVNHQKKLKQLIYQNNEFGTNSLNEFEKMYDSQNYENCLESLHLSNLKTEQITIQKLLLAIHQNPLNNQLIDLKLSDLYLSTNLIIECICNQISSNKNLKKLSLSKSIVLPKFLKILTDCLSQEQNNFNKTSSLQYLDLSYILIQNSKNEKILSDIIIKNLCLFIQNSTELQHLDLSGMEIKESILKILESVKINKTILSIHLNDNFLNVSLRDKALQLMEIDSQNYHQINDNFDYQQQNQLQQSIYQKIFLKQEKIQLLSEKLLKKTDFNFKSIELKKKAYEVKILNQQINKEQNKDQMIIQQYNKNGTFIRDQIVQDPMTFTRKLGLPESIFNENIYQKQELCLKNSIEQWNFKNSKKGDDCYVCQKYNYVQFFYNKNNRDEDFQRIENIELIDMLRNTFEMDNLDQLKKGSPILISSINQWVVTRLLDVRLYTYLLKADFDDYLVKQIKIKSLKSQGQLIAKVKSIEQSINFLKMLPFINQNQEMQILQFQAQIKLLESDINYLKEENAHVQKQLNLIKKRAQIIRQKIQNNGINSFETVNQKKIQAIKKSKKQLLKQFSSLFKIDEINEEQEFLNIFLDKDLLDDLQNCPKFKENQININYPNDDHDVDSVYVFAGFVKPGVHVIIVYDPELQEFFKREIVIEHLKFDLPILKAQNKYSTNFQIQDVLQFMKVENYEVSQNIFYTDFFRREFSSKSLEIETHLFFEINEYLMKNYMFLINLFKVYLSVDKVFLRSDIQKLTKFLIYLGLINSKIKQAKKLSKKEILNVKMKINIKEVFQIFGLKHTMMNIEENEQEINYNSLNKNKILNRYQFILAIIKIALMNYKIRGNYLRQQSQISSGRSISPTNHHVKFHNILNMQFVEYFDQIYMPKFILFVSKNQLQKSNFRQKYLLNSQLRQLINQNRTYIQSFFLNYKIKDKFNFESAQQMISEYDINLENLKLKLSHNEVLIRLFILCKQNIQNDMDLLMYSALEEIEFIEFLIRIAEQYYSQNIGNDLQQLYQQFYDLKQSENEDYENFSLRKRNQFNEIERQSMCNEPLEYKLFWLLKTKFSLNIYFSTNENIFFEFQFRRQLIHRHEIYNFKLKESELLKDDKSKSLSDSSSQGNYIEDEMEEILRESEYHKKTIITEPQTITSISVFDHSSQSVSNSSSDHLY